MAWWRSLFGNSMESEIAAIRQRVVEPVNALADEYRALSDDELRAKTTLFREQLANGATLESLIVPAFATVREAASRVLGQRHFDVQLIGGTILTSGKIAEMRTGEGKTLTSTLAIYTQALAGKGVHVVTVNDYLAKRDACWMGAIYTFLGLSVGIIQNQQVSYRYDAESADPDILQRVVPCSRRDAYQVDITYGTNNEFGFDYLRDNMVTSVDQEVQRSRSFAIIDEIDSILIDEARTPLIISAPAEESTEQYHRFARLVTGLRENEHYNVDEKMRAVTLSEAGITAMEHALGVQNIYAEGGLSTVHHLEQALRAQVLFKRDRDYVVQNNEVVIVDEFTGRLMPGRRYSEGLHQALEAKENVQIQRESQTLATITFQNYFRMYERLAGMTGTAATEAEEFSKIYNLEVTVVPTNRPMVRHDENDRIYKNERGKLTALLADIRALHTAGQPVLVGTISIEKNEELSNVLTDAGIPHQVLNAKQHEREAEIIAQAGKRGAVTLATNMAGRGVDIILGGKPPASDSSEYPAWQAEHDAVVALGGLAVIGTERHEARRIDNQLRGRSGRQGDPGVSRFLISLEDDLMRIFAPDRIKNMMEFLKVPEEMPIENKLISRSIESAQRKVEGNNFDIRKHLVEYDDVINKQRETIYRRRREILTSEQDTRTEILELIKQQLTFVVNAHTVGEDPTTWDVEEIYEVVNTIFPVGSDVRLKLEDIEAREARGKLDTTDARGAIVGYLWDLGVQRYNQLEQNMAEALGEPEALRRIEKNVLLRSIDTLWVEHLDAIDHLRRGIGLRGYGQRDPLIEYKREAFGLFKQLLGMIDQQAVYSIFKVGPSMPVGKSLLERQGVQLAGAQKSMTSQSAFGSAVSSINAAATLKPKERDASGEKVGRNDPCPCGARRPDGTPIKYKHCHGK